MLEKVVGVMKPVPTTFTRISTESFGELLHGQPTILRHKIL